MPTVQLTARMLAATPDPNRELFLWDTLTVGFGVKLRPPAVDKRAGGRWFVLRYRMGRGRAAPERRMVIGRVGSPWTIETARDEAVRLLAEVAKGNDPQAKRKNVPRVFSDLVQNWLAEEVQPKRKARTFSDYFALVHRLAIPELGRKPVDTIVRADIQKLHHALRNTPAQANSIVRILSSFFTWCEDVAGVRPGGSNPCRKVKPYPEKARERFLSPLELAHLGRVLRVVERNRPYVAGAVRLLVLTGARLNEVLSMQWAWIDLGAGTVRLPDAKRGPRTVYLSAPALAVLAGLPRVRGNPYVIPGGKEGTHLINLEKPWLRIRKAALIPDVRIHDLRHSYASFAVNSRETLPMIGALLGHTQARTTARYAHLDNDPMRAANERIGEKIGVLLDPAKAGAVAEIRSSRRGTA